MHTVEGTFNANAKDNVDGDGIIDVMLCHVGANVNVTVM